VGRHDPADALTDDLAQARGPGLEGVPLLMCANTGQRSVIWYTPAFSNAMQPMVTGCVNDFETAKSRRGVCNQIERKTIPKLLPTIQSVLPSGPPVSTRREARR